MKQVIAIHGKMHSGKSTAAAHLARNVHGVIKPFAKPIKDFAFLLGWNGIKNKKGRRLLQLLGTEVGRECISDTLWVDKWQASLGGVGENVTVICDDLRFQNEYEHLNKMKVDVLLIHVIRPEDSTPLKRLVAWLTPKHQSEQGINFNLGLKPIVIYNSGTISQLQDKIIGLL